MIGDILVCFFALGNFSSLHILFNRVLCSLHSKCVCCVADDHRLSLERVCMCSVWFFEKTCLGNTRPFVVESEASKLGHLAWVQDVLWQILRQPCGVCRGKKHRYATKVWQSPIIKFLWISSIPLAYFQ